jgi:hypothetical protein
MEELNCIKIQHERSLSKKKTPIMMREGKKILEPNKIFKEIYKEIIEGTDLKIIFASVPKEIKT